MTTQTNSQRRFRTIRLTQTAERAFILTMS